MPANSYLHALAYIPTGTLLSYTREATRPRTTTRSSAHKLFKSRNCTSLIHPRGRMPIQIYGGQRD